MILSPQFPMQFSEDKIPIIKRIIKEVSFKNLKFILFIRGLFPREERGYN